MGGVGLMFDDAFLQSLSNVQKQIAEKGPSGSLIDPGDTSPLPVDHRLDIKIRAEGGFISQLSFKDRQRLRKVTKMVHMKHYPTEMISDHEADRIIEAMAPETMTYLIERKWDDIK
jgi:hypothetical protein